MTHGIQEDNSPPPASVVLLTSIAMLAFAANSLLCRLALAERLIDPAGFTAVRVTAGAATLALVMLPQWRSHRPAPPDWRSVALLMAYMVFFSFAYVSLPAGTGALLLFGAVQVTMFGAAIAQRERFNLPSRIGLALAVGGLVYLVAPGVSAPDLRGSFMMIVAGMAWGGYSLRGRAGVAPLAATAGNFIYAVPVALLVALVFATRVHATWPGIVLAAMSGAVASALGYAVWYAALRHLARSAAATVQLSVPVIAAIGGVLLLAETVSLRLVLASAATLGGVALVISQRHANR